MTASFPRRNRIHVAFLKAEQVAEAAETANAAFNTQREANILAQAAGAMADGARDAVVLTPETQVMWRQWMDAAIYARLEAGATAASLRAQLAAQQLQTAIARAELAAQIEHTATVLDTGRRATILSGAAGLGAGGLVVGGTVYGIEEHRAAAKAARCKALIQQLNDATDENFDRLQKAAEDACN